MRDQPVPVGVRGDVGPLVGVRPQVEHLRHAQVGERLGPDLHRALLALLGEDELEVLVTHADDLTVVVEVDEAVACALVGLAGEVVELVVPVEVVLVLLAVNGGALEQAFRNVGVAGGGHQRREPVEAGDDAGRARAWLDVPRPADQRRDPEGAFPVGVLLAAERRGAGVRP